MKKSDYLKGSSLILKAWLDDLRNQLSAPKNSVSAKLQDYIRRQIPDDAIQSVDTFLKKRATVILYLNDTWNSDEGTPPYTEDEVRLAMKLLTPEDFNSDGDCIYCLGSFGSQGELAKHYPHCSI